MKRNLLFSLLLVLGVSTFGLTGCKSDSTSSTTSTEAKIASEDAASVVTAAVASNDGGLNDQLTDVADFVKSGAALSVPELSTSNLTRNGVIKERTFNSVDTTWTLKLERTFSNAKVTSSWTRQYQYWFSKNGKKQQYFSDVNGAADKVGFVIVPSGCTGTFTNPSVSHKLTSLEGGVIGAIDLIAKTVTVNSSSPYKRSATDTISTRNATRTSDHTLTLTLTNVVLPLQDRSIDGSCVRPTSGTITGEYVANITFQKNNLYSEKTVDRTFTINFSSTTGTTATIQVSGNGGAGSYSGKFDIGTGVLQ